MTPRQERPARPAMAEIEPYDARLHDWCVTLIGRWMVLVGVISGDTKVRFPDGRLIRTSPLQARAVLRPGDVVATSNSRYLLVGPRRRLRDVLASRDAASWEG